ncbi:hypothetical protein OG301_37690 [Streptomyces platensis]|uniref:hypothetical protein n=1 Tax=Streptomyces TaxID=1883 RepID=UPI00143E5F95|nr:MULTISPECIES: hypothetical protein [Streptomyces]MCX4639047.1 hypothetical protein [Streptomyces platensis]QIY59367.1 hypothetical protein HEP86_39140 [Streptomyces sp. RPA4-5]WJY42621.1 hypothetical protein QT196_38175 [Streptomyces sp. P9-2B-2]WSI53347.1 hypothetical protein OG229_00840 [Streptomyces platensis]WTI56612.1 hypothetical protein OG301_37690 [Streptomyces platensis]
MSYVRLEAWIGGEWLEVDSVSVTVMDSALTLSFEHQRTESGYRSLIWEPLEKFLKEYCDEPLVVVPLGRNLPVMFGPGAAGPFRLAEMRDA